jgi:phosphohistidine phosphatase
MKSLLLNRHAKSSWDNPQFSDFDRPLNDRGKADAPVMAQRLLTKQQPIDLILSSPAVRALATAQVFAEALNIPSEEIRIVDRVYLASYHSLLKVVNELDDTFDHVMLFGHNPGITDFANYLADADIGNIPTCGIAKINFETDHWSHVSAGTGVLKFFDYPKNV